MHVARTAIHDFAFDDTLTNIQNKKISGYDCFNGFIVPDAIFPAASRQGHAHQLLAQDIGENERCHDGGVGLDDELRRVTPSFPHVIFSFGTAPEYEP